MFSAREPEIEVIEPEAKPGAVRVPIEDSTDARRDTAFVGQEWTTKYFGRPDAPGNEYRVSFRDGYYYLETLKKRPGPNGSVYGYTGVMIPEEDLFNAVSVLVAAVRDKQTREKK